MPAKLSVNINKIATLRNSRGGNTPDLLQVATDCQHFGADGITVHPRPDERHIRYADVRALRPIVTTEFNIEGNPKEESFVTLVLEVKPEQVTLVPDSRGQLTSNHGWDTISEAAYLRNMIAVFKNAGIRTSVFVDPVTDIIRGAQQTGADRVELYTEDYARAFSDNRERAIASYVTAAQLADELNLGVNAGHDLSLRNLSFFATSIPFLKEVSIGHALVSDALYLGLHNVIQMYKRNLTPS